ncbi:helix-turn-helix domain-containing protein [Pseudoxanthomonas sp.]|uniref:MarR family transcriptional regulator n=1 Tax=Pseudoxanthomonas sp. TaxID=1871049 RepID=UPI002623EC44|nr:helix-turn-helix domain-containing protein [Pseudoxanthomonas sp.]WDS37226.1 MAG: helix-turn-helix domain-containing protein [Pseudoxanthomonas sp.]
MDLKPQELLVLLKVAAHPERKFTFAVLAQELAMSAAEVHASVKRATAAGLVNARGRGDWSPIGPALQEFLVHGVRYAFPAEVGPVKRGVPTAHAAEPLSSLLHSESDTPVWAHSQGSARGPSVSPIYRTAPQAALADPALHRLLALLDALRIGRVRERELAAQLLSDALKPLDAAA